MTTLPATIPFTFTSTPMSFGVGQSELAWGSSNICTAADVVRIPLEAKALGAAAFRMSCLWVQLDPNKNRRYKWANLDAAMDAVEAAGLPILLCVEPRRSILPIGIPATEANAESYGVFCGDIASRYGDRISWYEIGNEVNSLSFFGAPSNPSKYVDFLREAAENIRPNVSSAKILTAGLMGAVGTDRFLGRTMSAPDWAELFYDSNPQEYFDGFGLHPYCTDPGFTPIPVSADANPFTNLQSVRATMDANGDSAKKIFVTEWGFNDVQSVLGSTNDAELQAEQALKLSQEWEILKTFAADGAIDPTVYIYNYRDQHSDDNRLYRYGLVHFDYSRKQSWDMVRSWARSTSFTPSTANVPLQVWDPEVEVHVDTSHVKPGVASIPVQAWSPTIVKPIKPSSVSIPVQVWAPTVGILSNVQYVSTGVGDSDFTVGLDVTLTWDHVVSAESYGALLSGLDVSTDHLKPWEFYNTISVSSSIDGDLTRLGSRHIAASSVKKGSVHIFGLTNVDGTPKMPTPGTHTMTAHVVLNNDFTTSLTAVNGNSVLYRGVSAFGSVFSNGNSSGTPNVTATSATDRMVFFVFGGSNNYSGTFNKSARWSAGSTVDGDGDFILIGDAAGAASVNGSCSLSFVRYGALALDLRQVSR